MCSARVGVNAGGMVGQAQLSVLLSAASVEAVCSMRSRHAVRRAHVPLHALDPYAQALANTLLPAPDSAVHFMLLCSPLPIHIVCLRVAATASLYTQCGCTDVAACCRPVPQELANILLGAARLGYDHDHQLIHVLLSAFVRHPGPFKPQVSGCGKPAGVNASKKVKACRSRPHGRRRSLRARGSGSGCLGGKAIRRTLEAGARLLFRNKPRHSSLLTTFKRALL